VSAPQRIIQSNNLAGYPADGIVDANGLLRPAFVGYLGTRGHMMSGETGGGGTTLTAPTNVRIISSN
jgi:hypothetical protein